MANIHRFMKIGGVTSEKEFYSKYPTDEDFFNKYPEHRPLAMSNGMMQMGGQSDGQDQFMQFVQQMVQQHPEIAKAVQSHNPKIMKELQQAFQQEQQQGPPQGQQAPPPPQQGMQMGGAYLDYMGLNPALAGMQYGGVNFIDDKRGYHDMQTPGEHYTNDGFKKTTGSNMNGNSWSKFGGNVNEQFMPAPLEYAYLQDGGFAGNGPMIYDETEEMKTGGIHIKKENVGKFTATKKATGKSTEELTHSSNPITKKRAVFAQNAKHWNKKEFGGALQKFMKNGGDVQGLQKFMKYAGVKDDSDTIGQEAPETFPTKPANYEDPTLASNLDPKTAVVPPYQTGLSQQIQSELPPTTTDEQAAGIQKSIDNRGSYTPDSTGYMVNAGENLLGAGLATASFFEDRRNQRNMQGYNRQLGQSDSVFGAQKLNTTGNKGDYNQQGVFRPNANTPYAPTMQYPTAATGGHYSAQGGFIDGSIHDLPDHEINRLKSLGYKIEFV